MEDLECDTSGATKWMLQHLMQNCVVKHWLKLKIWAFFCSILINNLKVSVKLNWPKSILLKHQNWEKLTN